MSDQTSADNSINPVTVVISRRVIKGREAEFERLSSQMTERAARYPGYLGASMFRPASSDDPEYRIIFKFSEETDTAALQQAFERGGVFGEIEPLLVAPSQGETNFGIHQLFNLPGPQ